MLAQEAGLLDFECSTSFLDLRVCTDHPELFQVLKNFLDLAPMPAVRERVKLNFTITAAAEADAPFFFHQFEGEHFYETASAAPHATASLDIDSGLVSAKVFSFTPVNRERVLETVFMRPLRVALAARGYFSLHASIVADEGDRCIIFSGPSGSGKTTLAFSLVSDRQFLVTDDDCFIRREDHQIWYFPLATKAGIGAHLSGMLASRGILPDTDMEYGGKRRLRTDSVNCRPASRPLDCQALVFPRYEKGAAATLREISRHEACERLVRSSYPRYPQGQAHGDLAARHFLELSALSRAAPAYVLTYGHESLPDARRCVERLRE